MKYLVFYIPGFLLAIFSQAYAGEPANVTLFFSPKGGIETEICRLINTANDEILVAAYSFSSTPIAHALYTAAKRGVTVQVILDRRQPTIHYSMANDLAINGLAVRIDRREPLMHMKIIILDNEILIAGSYNFSASAEHRNAEIVTIIKSKIIASQAIANWRLHWNHSIPHNPRARPRTPKRKTTQTTSLQTTSCPPMSSFSNPRPRQKRKLQWSN